MSPREAGTQPMQTPAGPSQSLLGPTPKPASSPESAASPAAVRRALESVHDPEIPTISIVDLGLVEAVRCEGDRVEVDLLPTFTGCPALDIIRADVERTVAALPQVSHASVRFLLSPAWSTDRVSERGRAQLQAFGIAPPAQRAAQPVRDVPCPFCGRDDTVLESSFGPTRCRTIYYCRSCRNPFEKIKEV